ncbi:MAG TPA: flagellar hook-associated protein FlgL [Acidobacteriota bacterium]|nr:flagellar hook-associated protein FlgL [Acidobacteriota bacterium]
MNVTTSTMYRSFLSNLNSLDEQLVTVNQQISTGKKNVYLRDSPASGAESVLLREESAEIDQYKASTDSSGFYLQAADSALNSIQNLIAGIQTRGIEATSATLDATNRDAIAKDIRSLRDQMLSLANTEVQGRYVFAGSRILAPPFSMVGDAVSYLGDTQLNQIKVSDDLTVQQNVAGSTALSPVFDAIQSLLSEIDAGDQAGIVDALAQLTSSLDPLNVARGEVGAQLGKVANVKSELDTEAVNLHAYQSRIEDVNAAEAAVRLGQVQTAVKATMSAGQSILQQQNLFDFLV